MVPDVGLALRLRPHLVAALPDFPNHLIALSTHPNHRRLLLDKLFVNWRTTLVGVVGLLAVLVPPIQAWLANTAHLNTTSILALVLAVLGALSTDANKTP
jgi:hypothetical protein